MSFHPNEIARRGRLASIGLIVLFGALIGRFFSLQVLQHAQYVLASDKNRLNEVPLPAPRGIIYDRAGVIIAENVPGYTVSILAPRVDSLRAILKRLGTRITLTQAQVDAAVARHKQTPNRPTVLFGAAPFDIVSVLEEHRVEYPGLIIQSSPKRYYPDSTAASAFVGFTSEINEAELASDRGRGYKPGQQIGKAGLEVQYDSVLHGTEGSRFVEVDARQRVVRDAGVRAELPPVSGSPLHTNIDMDLQRFVYRLFADSLVGAAVAMEPATGAVLAIHSAPGYDPNRFIGGASQAFLDQLNADPRKPLYNKAIQGVYAPGSTWKLATAIIGLQDSLVKMDDVMPQRCDGGFQFGNRYYRCWNKDGHGRIDLKRAIEQSCDVYFYQLGLRVTLAGLVGGGRKLEFGERTHIDLPGETTSDFPPARPDSMRAYYNKKFPRGWGSGGGEAMNFAIGQGANAETVIAMARFYTALATDGQAARPMLVGNTPARTRLFQLSDAQMQQVRDAMVGVVQSGTAAAAAIHGVTFAGKTGSAQNAQDVNRDHAWFVGFAPAENPKIVVAVLLEFGLHGPRAALIAKSIVEHYLKTAVSAPVITGD